MNDRLEHLEFKRSRRRARSLERHIPKDGVGVEIGVFWAHFSERIMQFFQPRKLHLVDPWNKLFGEFYPKWGDYTLRGKLSTTRTKQAAYDLAKRYPDVVEVHETYGADFLADQPDGSLDWVYLDASHKYEKVAQDLRDIEPKLAPDGIIIGDDYYLDERSKHHGVLRAVNAFAHETKRKLVLENVNQYMLLPKHANRP